MTACTAGIRSTSADKVSPGKQTVNRILKQAKRYVYISHFFNKAPFTATVHSPTEENSEINWRYYRDSFLLPAFGDLSLADMNDEDRIQSFMREIADRKFSEHTAKKAFTFAKALLDMSRDLGITRGNASRLIPKNRRIPRGVTKSKSQPAITVEQFIAILNEIKKPRDQVILNLLFFCALRRSEPVPPKWKDFRQDDGRYMLNIERSFDSRTHRIKGAARQTGRNSGKGPGQSSGASETGGINTGMGQVRRYGSKLT